jgi:hypothetical protein
MTWECQVFAYLFTNGPTALGPARMKHIRMNKYLTQTRQENNGI